MTDITRDNALTGDQKPSQAACCKRVHERGYWDTRGHPCGRKAKVLHDGKWYCGMHDPVRAKRKHQERRDAWDAKWAVEREQRKLELAAPDLLALAKAYEAWEADIILNNNWDGRGGLPTLTEQQYTRMLTLQVMRNAVIAKATGSPPAQPNDDRPAVGTDAEGV